MCVNQTLRPTSSGLLPDGITINIGAARPSARRRGVIHFAKQEGFHSILVPLPFESIDGANKGDGTNVRLHLRGHRRENFDPRC